LVCLLFFAILTVTMYAVVIPLSYRDKYVVTKVQLDTSLFRPAENSPLRSHDIRGVNTPVTMTSAASQIRTSVSAVAPRRATNDQVVQGAWERFKNYDLVTIRGYYSSGTNWLRELVNANCKMLKFSDPKISIGGEKPFDLDGDGIYGWKHGFFKEKEIEAFKKMDSHRMVIISRDVMTWIVSAFRMSAGIPTDGRRIFRRFPSFLEYATNMPVNENGIPDGRYFDAWFDNQDLRNQYRVIAPNIFDARTQVYKNWLKLLELDEFKSRVVFIRYEDLRENPYERFSSLVQQLKLASCNVEDETLFDPIKARRKYHRSDLKSRPQEHHPREEFCVYVRDEATYAKLLSKVDRAFEKKLGYEYPDTLREYCQDAVYSPKSSYHV